MKCVMFSAAFLSLCVLNAPAASEADVKELRDFRITFDRMIRYEKAGKALAKLERENAAFKKQMEDAIAGAASTSAKVAALDNLPGASEAIHAAGMSSREFVVMTGTAVSTMVAVGMKRSGRLKEFPSTVSPENAAFVSKNFDLVSAMFDEIMTAREAAPK